MIETKISYGVNSSFELRRLKDFAKINKGKQLKEDEYFNGPYPYINGGMNPSGYINIYNNQGPFIAISEGGASAGYSQIFEGNVWVGAHCYVLKTNQNLKYVYYVLKGFEKEIMSRKTGSAMPNLQKSKFNNTLFPIIYNSYRQENIVKYLDKIDYILLKQIKKYNKKIDLLKEYKEALIYETVTKGFNEKSNISWKTKRLKDIIYLNKGKAVETVSEQINDYLPLIDTNYLRNRKDNIVYSKNGLYVKKNEVLVLWDGANSGEMFYNINDGFLGSTFGVMKLKSKVNNSKFLFYYLKAFEKNIRKDIVGMGIPHVNGTKLKQRLINIPENSEQNEIVDFLDKKTKEIDVEVEKLSKKIELIEELKESIIYECVTGKLDIEIEGEKYQKIIESI